MKRLLLLPSLLACAVAVRAQDCDPQATAQLLVEREAQFYQMGQEKGARTAFLTYFADDAIGFEPGPVNAKQLWAARAETEMSYKWQPLLVGVAGSCDLAFTTGPSEWRKTRADEKPIGYGQYVTVWKKQTTGEWKVAVDLGGHVPGARISEEAPELVINTGPAQVLDPLTAPKKLRQAEKWFADAAATDSTAALIGSSSEDIRVHREGVFPAVGRDPAKLMLSVRRGKLAFERLGGALSEAKDLAYSYGKYTIALSQSSERGHYLQIWRPDATGTWKLVLDHQTPLPKETAR